MYTIKGYLTGQHFFVFLVFLLGNTEKQFWNTRFVLENLMAIFCGTITCRFAEDDIEYVLTHHNRLASFFSECLLYMQSFPSCIHGCIFTILAF